MNIASVIRELLLYHEKVVIPDFGTFTIKHHPAQLNKITGMLLPPSKEVLFDSTAQTDDGRLTGYIVRNHQLEKGDISASLADFVKTIEDQLDAKGTAYIENMGKLTRDKAGRFGFEPLDELLDKADLFKLPKFNISVTRPVAAPRVTKEPVQYQPESTEVHRKKRRWWIPVSLLCILAAFSVFAYFTGLYKIVVPGKTDQITITGDKDEAGRLVFGERSAGSTDTAQERISRELDRRTAREQALRYEDSAGIAKEPIKTPAVNREEPVFSKSSKPYHVIAGAFLVPNNANRQKSKFEAKGFSPLLLRRGNYIMVSLGDYDSKEQADAAMEQLREQLNQELWVMKRGVRSRE